MKDTLWDVAIVGAGAAGLMTAVMSRRAGLQVLLLEGKEKIGAKILISGGTRCNVTNDQVSEKDFESEAPRTVRNILAAFPSTKAVEFFEELGVSLVLEPGGKYFPVTHSGRTVLEAFLQEVQKTGVVLKTAQKVTNVCAESGRFALSGAGFHYFAKNVVLACGGLSYPATGSDGTGYSIAKSFGHGIIRTTPSLTPLETQDSDFKILSGISLPVRLTLWADEKKRAAYEGSFLFTHFGFSGPVVLNISRHWIREKSSHAVKMTADFLPSEKEEALRETLSNFSQKGSDRPLKNFLGEKLPTRFAEVLMKKLNISADTLLHQLTREDREKLLKALFHFPLPVHGALGYEKAEVTAGGANLSEVDPKTLESKLRPGLFFVGEILDVDGRIGGFNFQWAWASGAAAAEALRKKKPEFQKV